MWKEKIKSDFGCDLPIGDGSGGTVETPIIMKTKDPIESASAKLTLIQCIMSVLGQLWKVTGSEIIYIDNRKIEKLIFDAKWPENDQFITETRAYYFDVTNVDDPQNRSPISFGIDSDEKIGIRFPLQLGWVHFVNKTVYERPELGESYYYFSTKIKATIYEYNKGFKVLSYIASNDGFINEFESANHDFVSVNPSAKISWDKQKDNLLLRSYLVNDVYEVIMLTIVDNNFIKLRLTCSEPQIVYVYDCMIETINDFMCLIRTQN